MKIEVNNPCIICGSTDSKLIFETEYPLHNYPGKFIIRKCIGCGLLFNSPRLIDEELYRLYDKNYYFFQSPESDELIRTAQIFLRTVALIPDNFSDKRVMEVGSAKGYLLALMKNLGWNVQGIEISHDASNYAISKFRIPTFTGTIEDYVNSIERKIFPLVLALDVIEHVPNPINFLNNIDKIIDKDGLLIIDTPNADAQNIEYLNHKWAGFNPFHIYFFSISILKSILTGMGYTIEQSFSYNNKIKRMDLFSDLKALLFKIGLFNQFKHVFRIITGIKKKNELEVESFMNSAAEIVKNSPNYLESDDSSAELAEDKRGHNILIIARKN